MSQRLSLGTKTRLAGARAVFLGVGALGILSCALILGLFAWQTIQIRADRIEREKEALSRMAEIVASETEDMLTRVKFFMTTADLWLAAKAGADPRSDPTLARLVESFGSTGKGSIDIYLVSEEGGLFSIPSASKTPLADVRDRDYFVSQTRPSTEGFFIGAPARSRVTQIWVIPVSYPLHSRNAGISVILASIEMPMLEKLYDTIRPKPNGSVTLMRSDGMVLARVPFEDRIMGTSVSNPEIWIADIAKAPTGTWVRRTSTTDNEERVVAYKRLDSFPIVVSVSSRLGDILAEWKADLWWRASMAVLMLVAIGSVSARLLRALARLDSIQTDLQSNLERLRKSDATKDKLFTLIAHDLRGPIGGMSNLLEMMATDRADMESATVDEFIGALRLASWNTYQLLENLLSWSKSQKGDLPFRPERVVLYPLVEASRSVFALSIASKSIAISVDVDSTLEMRADPELAKVIFRNLISNAVKFTPKGGTVGISARREGSGTRVSVLDGGIGMSGEELGALFDLGTTKSRSGTDNERGSGLGLVLCREMIELHGGSIEAQSAVGKGSSFSVFFPD